MTVIRDVFKLGFCCAAALALAAAVSAAPPRAGDAPEKNQDDSEQPQAGKFEPFKPEAKISTGSVTVGGQVIPYQAIAGTLIVHPKDWDDVPRDPKTEKENSPPPSDGDKNPTAEASIFYVAYFKTGGGPRPVTFLYNGGPGSATLWLHIGAFGPRRIVTSTDAHTPAAPYSLVNNGASLLDATDLVFIDAPGTGFSRIAGKDKEKAFSASIRTPTPSPNSSRSFSRSTAAGIRRNICSARATEPPRSAMLDQSAGSGTLDRFQRRDPVIPNPEFRSQP